MRNHPGETISDVTALLEQRVLPTVSTDDRLNPALTMAVRNLRALERTWDRAVPFLIGENTRTTTVLDVIAGVIERAEAPKDLLQLAVAIRNNLEAPLHPSELFDQNYAAYQRLQRLVVRAVAILEPVDEPPVSAVLRAELAGQLHTHMREAVDRESRATETDTTQAMPF